jgi:hypothetical protein
LALTLGACSESWSGYVYPHRDNLGVHVALGRFQSLDACRASAKEVLMVMHATESGDYECGLNCDRKDEGPDVCARTER